MDRQSFLRKHLWAGIGLILGPAITIGSLILHAYALIEMGLPIDIWVAIGLAIFFLSTIGILYGQHQHANNGQILHHAPVLTTEIAKSPGTITNKTSTAFETLTNYELRLAAHNLSSRLSAFADNHFRERTNIPNRWISQDDKSSQTIMLDEAFNREFRETYESEVISIYRELISRIKDNNERLISFPSGIVDWFSVNQAGVRLVSLSNRLP